MAKNYVQDGNTIAIENVTTKDIASGAPVAVGSIVAIAITDIKVGEVGDGLTTGVYLLPKLAADAIAAGTKVNLKNGKVQLADGDVVAGVAWDAAAAATTVLAVKING
ncbi:DUF2190 family protein [Budviciaceae bacterium CWB-B4]|uniref:DUF2190 family protein n=1 Tax=Limnobaculum xujianqingii TaxID=2738837 RepID=A0A9D7FWL9_9GAMM|nr:capsid cement protein [Limnobaculum xujianqingii]MBK5072227.1 DUF2190 family protein [Limnobaculum xujianqingii]MBK5175536.1 DUF2190 family protein [Limnobaculum xujianqingii]